MFLADRYIMEKAWGIFDEDNGKKEHDNESDDANKVENDDSNVIRH